MPPGRKCVSAGLGALLPVDEPRGPACNIPVLAVLGVRRQPFVADQPIGPEVGDTDLESIVSRLDDAADLQPPGRTPDYAQVMTVETYAGEVFDDSKIEPET
jgi:hypothetical protein